MSYPPPPSGGGQPPYGAPPPYGGQPGGYPPQPGGYPPQPGGYQGGPPGYYPPQPPKKRGNGCLIAVIVTILLVVLLCGAGGFAAWRLWDEVEDSVPGLGGAECPTEEKVSDIVGSDVELVLDSEIIVASGCNYTGDKVSVSIVKGAELIADEVKQEFRTEARNNGAEVRSIDVGEGGLAYGSPRASAAITESDGLIQVDVFGTGGQQIGDKSEEAIELLEVFIELQ